MSVMDNIIQKAKANKKKIVLPEGTEPRTLKAAEIVLKEGIADLVLLGKEEEIREKAKGLDISKAEIVDPEKSPNLERYAKEYYELRKNKGMTEEEAERLMRDPMYYGCMMVKLGDVDGMVSGAIHATADVFRPAFQIIKTAPNVKVVSSAFIMEVPECKYGSDGVFIFADCAINPNPTAEELAAIAIASAHTAKVLAGIEPKVAMLSFSTKGSASHELVDKVKRATEIAKELAPDLLIDGELQVDAAIVKEVGELKAPGSPVAGQANVLIFPDLQAGNIGYKLVQRLAKANAIGPISQGLAKPVNDLSRGCSVEDIVNVIAITSVQAQGIV
ncbi:phosphate acetyltransferase [Caldanaerobacter subterraneus]|uniref:Phosphate acetyltransferase n=4 Tax=Caldanaerobacter subterraneus TaxID=911092 RepID=Q8R9V3_CALS4|nr:phosphate acetyltransferase [Caldanaerobacter subterraneus]AAM24701.1 Phosphotransacetylase [Caldanaerobacter subterraneus subsp. tengcongensis MB4]ERM92408.1 phosphotransacetylase [Caldanaerobacter subterraneus subsp. yonseiensis KB-1]KKC29548.1 phosphotransacetylase [Caldanaerobacter subterraneus subsp. pacificus DSM 12653]MBE3579194.1 phosphate acetyltransferase [Caldanaerobacter subterraneus]MCS3915735.1 phosphate acetyltransferase [Caldanaerobacter subterraneus subsp. tengcongensis MB4